MKAVKSYLTAITILISGAWFCETAVAADNAQSAKSTQKAAQKPQNDDSNRIEFENAELKMIVIPRTREQMKAFYEGRGFPAPAISAVAQACFMTVVVKNKTRDVLWLELDNWRFSGGNPDAKRLDRAYWKQRWDALKIPMANRSTFGWTLLPEQRDLRADEGVGGNITMAFNTASFTLDARFYQGEDKSGGPVSVHLAGIQCAE